MTSSSQQEQRSPEKEALKLSFHKHREEDEEEDQNNNIMAIPPPRLSAVNLPRRKQHRKKKEYKSVQQSDKSNISSGSSSSQEDHHADGETPLPVENAAAAAAASCSSVSRRDLLEQAWKESQVILMEGYEGEVSLEDNDEYQQQQATCAGLIGGGVGMVTGGFWLSLLCATGCMYAVQEEREKTSRMGTLSRATGKYGLRAKHALFRLSRVNNSTATNSMTMQRGDEDASNDNDDDTPTWKSNASSSSLVESSSSSPTPPQSLGEKDGAGTYWYTVTSKVASAASVESNGEARFTIDDDFQTAEGDLVVSFTMADNKKTRTTSKPAVAILPPPLPPIGEDNMFFCTPCEQQPSKEEEEDSKPAAATVAAPPAIKSLVATNVMMNMWCTPCQPAEEDAKTEDLSITSTSSNQSISLDDSSNSSSSSSGGNMMTMMMEELDDHETSSPSQTSTPTPPQPQQLWCVPCQS